MNNPIDKAIEYAFPGWGERRVRSRHNLKVMAQMLPGYKGGSDTRRRRQVTGSSNREDTGLSGTYSGMISAAMNLYRNDPMTRSIVDVVNTYMGESRPMGATGDAEWDAEATEYFNSVWWGRADARKRPGVDFGELQSLWDRWCWLGGDMLFLLYDGSLYPYEGTQIKTPYDLRQDDYVVNGIRIQRSAPHMISHYYVTEGDKPSFFSTAKKDFKRIRQNEAIFAPSQYWRTAMLRGVPGLHAVIDALQDWEETNDNVQGMIKLHSSIWTMEKKGSLSNTPGRKFLDASSADGTQVEYTAADYGMRVKVNGDPEHDFVMQKMDNPGSEHVPYMEFMGRVIAAGTGLPYEIVMHLYTNGSYTANRAARCDFKAFLLKRWAWRNKVLNQRVWNWSIAKAMKSRELPLAPTDAQGRSLWYKCSWTLPYLPQIDEGKESVANARRWRMADKSLSDLAQEQGKTQTQMLDAHDSDLSAMQERARALGLTLSEYAGELFKQGAEQQPPTQKGTE